MRGMEATNARYGGGLSAPDRADPRIERGQMRSLARPLLSGLGGLLAQMSNYGGAFLANRYVIFAMRAVLASVFLLSACGKLVNIRQYSIGPAVEFAILPIPVAHVFGAVLPFVELLCALGLLFGVVTRLSSFGIAAMSAAFFIAKASLLMRGLDIACGCFGAIVTTLASLTIYMDPPIFLMALAVLLSPAPARRWLSLSGRRLVRRGEGVDLVR
jgi:putative oxidoreductase